jgi:hypothetical protein
MISTRLPLLVLGSTLVLLSTNAPRALQIERVVALENAKLRLILPKPPKDPGAPKGRRKGGSSRSGAELAICPKPHDLKAKTSSTPCQLPALTALVPTTQGADQEPFVWGLTTESRPTLWFVIPKTEAAPVEFILQDDQDRYLYRTSLQMPPQSSEGIVEFALPASAPPLQVNQRYTWTVLLEATASHPTQFVQGSLYRVSAVAGMEPDQVNSLEQVARYAKQGLWHDSLTALAKLRQTHPQDSQIQGAWFDLLQQAGLGAIADFPLLSCCSAKALQADSPTP